MKKTYFSPVVDVIEVKTAEVVLASGEIPEIDSGDDFL